MRLRVGLIALGVLVLAFPAQAVKAQTITEIVAASGDGFDRNPFDYDILLTAVGAAGLADALNNPKDDLTVFAPTILRSSGPHGIWVTPDSRSKVPGNSSWQP